ncbi:LytTR family DNA-binding domain-containing protein [Bacteroides sp. 519]|uniref:LytR/AlgR family response regulator transcription factor n=1 Tax=Bacteroides sp. 519 TaxID=2302937 RepID=UPI0013D1FBCA|nr:LytTR family DNA-binding domain-containing protein [Bacteroides sp. 519]NDV59357.1 DNA-binding response regulator [Bacteroides sp. 519]
MKAIIIEDEKAAVRNLVALIHEIRPEAEVIATLDSINSTIEWFNSSSVIPDVIFMDIHLADGSAFEIFEHIKITTPVIFTTAYDEYALRAFKVNSIDYLLKPIDREDMEKALEQFDDLYTDHAHTFHDSTLEQLMHSLRQKESYKTHFLIPLRGDKLLPVAVSSILFFYIRDSRVKAVMADGNELPFTHTMDELTDCLDPSVFFRVNRQFLISRDAIKDIDLWFNNRLSINLKITSVDEHIIVSKTRVREFKDWFSGNYLSR